MQLNERWLWLGDTLPAADAGVTVLRAHPGCWWLSCDRGMVGPLDERAVLRAVRVACTPTIDGCEHGPQQLAINQLAPKASVQRRKSWRPVTERELPPSITSYDRAGLAPISGCKTTFEAMPRVAWEALDASVPYEDEVPDVCGRLKAPWNVHPQGSLIFTDEPRSLDSGFVIVDLPSA